MWNKPTLKQLQKIPKLYSQEDVKDKKIYMKFFIGADTWYVAEIDKDLDTMFCYHVNERTKQGSWGYTSLKQLMNLRVGFVEVDRDLYSVTPYSPKKLSQLR